MTVPLDAVKVGKAVGENTQYTKAPLQVRRTIGKMLKSKRAYYCTEKKRNIPKRGRCSSCGCKRFRHNNKNLATHLSDIKAGRWAIGLLILAAIAASDSHHPQFIYVGSPPEETVEAEK